MPIFAQSTLFALHTALQQRAERIARRDRDLLALEVLRRLDVGLGSDTTE
jgi:hypothetical protein